MPEDDDMVTVNLYEPGVTLAMDENTHVVHPDEVGVGLEGFGNRILLVGPVNKLHTLAWVLWQLMEDMHVRQ